MRTRLMCLLGVLATLATVLIVMIYFVSCNIVVYSSGSKGHAYVTATRILERNTDEITDIIQKSETEAIDKQSVNGNEISRVIRSQQLFGPGPLEFNEQRIASGRLLPGTWLIIETSKNGIKAKLIEVHLKDKLLTVDFR